MATQPDVDRKFLVFSFLKDEFGLDINWVREVVEAERIHSLPQAPSFIEGLMDVRGYIVVAVDLRKKFNLAFTREAGPVPAVICKVRNIIVGLLVDKVSGVLSFHPQEIHSTPALVAEAGYETFIAGIAQRDGRFITLLDLEKIFSTDDVTKICEIRNP